MSTRRKKTGRHIAADRRQAGFSLVELMVVIGAAAVLMAILVLGIRRASESFALRRAASVAVSELRRAQAAAIAEGMVFAVEFNLSGPEKIRVSRPKDDGTCPTGMVDNGTVCTRTIASPENWPSSVAIESANFNGSNEVSFVRLGAPDPPNGGVVKLKSGSGVTWSIVVEPATGKVSVQR